MARIFHSFRPQGTGTFVRWASRREREDGCPPEQWRRENLVYIPTGSENEVETPLQSDMGLDFDSFSPGDPVRLQFGEMSKNTSRMRGGTRYVRRPYMNNKGLIDYTQRALDTLVGNHCISAMALGAPRIHLLSVRTLSFYFGPAVAAAHLRDWRAGASTHQHEIELKQSRRDQNPLHIDITAGLLGVSMRLSDRVRIAKGVVHLQVEIPETVLISLPGMPLATLTDHPVMADGAPVVARANRSGSTIQAHTDAIVGVDEAIALLDLEAASRPAVALPMAA